MAKLKVGDKIIFTKDDDVVDAYFIGDKGVIVEICNEGSETEHYTITMTCGKQTWAEDSEVRLRQKKQKKWLKATPELIAQLQVGDNVKLRNGEKATIIGAEHGNDHQCHVEHDCNEFGGYMACNSNGENCIGDLNSKPYDIVKIKNKDWVKENA